MLLETRDPSRPDYDRAASLKAMRWMKQVVDNRLAAPKKSRFGEPEDAATETDIISVGNPFAGFGDHPALSSAFTSKLDLLLHLADTKKDKRSDRYAAFVQDAITAATEPVPPAESRVTNLAAWRTAAAKGPGGAFKFVGTLQGNDFYSASPIPPMPAKRTHAHGK